MKARNLFVAVAMLCVATTAFAGTSSYYISGVEYLPGAATGFAGAGFLNGANDVIATPNLGTANNPTVYIQPRFSTSASGCTNRHVLAGVDTSVSALQLWARVENSAAVTEIMGSLGFDVSATGGTNSYSVTIYDNMPSKVGSTVDPWDGTNIVTPPTTDLRMVTVPESVPDFAVTGLAPNAGGASYRVATVTATAPCTAVGTFVPTTATIKLSVGNVLIARINDPSEAAVGAETINLGWSAAGVPESVAIPGGCTATAAGSCVGAGNAMADATVITRFKGDGNGDGTVSSADNGSFNLAKLAVTGGTATTLQKYVFDLNVDGTASSADNGPFNLQKLCFTGAFAACP